MTEGNGDVMSSAQDTMREVQDRMSDGMEGLRGYAESADSTIREFARERPLLALGCALGLGFVIGRIASRM